MGVKYEGIVGHIEKEMMGLGPTQKGTSCSKSLKKWKHDHWNSLQTQSEYNPTQYYH